MNSFFRKLSWLAQRRRKEDELREELQFHLDEEAGQRQAQGLAEQPAKWSARRELGNVALLQEYTRAAWGWTTLEQLGQDLRYASRTMASNRLFTLLAVLSLGLGIGANTAIYSFVDFILLRSLPVSDPSSLAILNWHANRGGRDFVVQQFHGAIDHDPGAGLTSGIFPFAAFELFRNDHSVFSTLFGYYSPGDLTLTVQGQAEVARGEYVTGDYFRGLGVAPAAGRPIIPDDDRAGAPATAVVSFALSQRRFGGPANAVGQSIRINNVVFVVVGVTPPEFFGVSPGTTPDVYLPMHAGLLLPVPLPPAAWYVNKNTYWIRMMGRLRPGVTIVQAEKSLAERFHQWVDGTATGDAQRTDLPALKIREGAGGLDALRRLYSKPLYLLMTLAGLILAIACANIANLLLVRGVARKREIALRLSLGAHRSRVVRQLLTESVLLAALGGALGVVFAIWGIRFLTMLLANGDADFIVHPQLNWQVLAAAFALSLMTGVLFGIAPAIHSTRVAFIPALKGIGAGQSYSRTRASLSHLLLTSQIAMSFVLLFAAGLFVRTLSNIQSVELGFDRENVLLFQVNAQQAGHRDPEMALFYASLQQRLLAVPGVRDVSLSANSLIGEGTWSTPIHISGALATGDNVLPAGSGFFTTMRIPMRLGREINQGDVFGSPAVAVVNREFVKANFGDANPLGRRLTLGEPWQRDVEIVGVSDNVRYDSVKESVPPLVYLPYRQSLIRTDGRMTYALRTSGDPSAYATTVREIVHQADARVPVAKVRTQAVAIDRTINQEIVFARLCTAFAILALVIACVGLYGTVAYNVARRTAEIGIRVALGARRGTVIRMVLREVFLLAAVGLAISVPAAFGAAKFVESFLFGMKANDPLALTIAVAILLLAALLAGYVPALKASRIDPTIALRHE